MELISEEKWAYLHNRIMSQRTGCGAYDNKINVEEAKDQGLRKKKIVPSANAFCRGFRVFKR